MTLTYASIQTPFGIAVAIASDSGLRSVSFESEPPLGVIRRHDADIVPDDSGVAGAAVRQLAEYFDGERREFDLALDLSEFDGFVKRVFETMTEIPFGETASYGEVAVRAGAPGAARAVGTACARTPIAIVIPAHRVIRSDGSIGEFGGRPELKRRLLQHEGALAPG